MYKYPYKYLYKYGPVQEKGVIFQEECAPKIPAGHGCPRDPSRLPARFYEHKDYQGDSFGLCIGDECANLGPEWNDRISSMIVPARAAVTIYEHINFGGENAKFQSLNNDLRINLTDYHFKYKFPPKSWNDQVSSIKVVSTI
jgi:hypothetical protein